MRNEKWWCGENAISTIARANPASLRSAAPSKGRGEWGSSPRIAPLFLWKRGRGDGWRAALLHPRCGCKVRKVDLIYAIL